MKAKICILMILALFWACNKDVYLDDNDLSSGIIKTEESILEPAVITSNASSANNGSLSVSMAPLSGGFIYVYWTATGFDNYTTGSYSVSHNYNVITQGSCIGHSGNFYFQAASGGSYDITIRYGTQTYRHTYTHSNGSGENTGATCLCSRASGYISSLDILETRAIINASWYWSISGQTISLPEQLNMLLKYTVNNKVYSQEETVFRGDNNITFRYPYTANDDIYIEASIYCPAHTTLLAGRITQTIRTPIP